MTDPGPGSARAEAPRRPSPASPGVVLFWVYDASPGQQRTRLLVKRVVPIVDKLVRMSRLPVVRGVVDDLVTLTDDLRS